MPRLHLALHHLRQHFGDDRAVQITSDRLTSYANNRRSDGAALASISTELAALRRAFNLAGRAGRLMSRPHFPTIKLNNTRQGFFEEADFRAVQAELPEHLRPLMTCGFLTGWRTRDELRPMTWDRVDLKAGTVRLERSKNNDGRVFPINADPELAELFRQQRAYTDEVQKRTGQVIRHVFHKDGRPIGDYYKAWRSACKKAGLPGRIPHDFRRSAARRLIQGGVPEQVAMRLVGWKSRAMLDRYFVVNERDLAEAVARIATLRVGAPAQTRKALPMRSAEA